ncbi:MAG TPA: DUF6265 family protein [Myxococcota bacterium]|nr:DUF6265 family protein [Myxococcota bacterium]HRY93283.1 DUF6265 family protein [Myxococcota bacterium]HSA23519.1 DUF6265 family protein [Myxococcota bacterium]
MRTAAFLGCACLSGALAFGACAANPGSAPRPAAPAAALDGLGWLPGVWSGPDGEDVVEEHWCWAEAPGGGRRLEGLGRRLAGERLVFQEVLAIEAEADGLVYRAWPRGEPLTGFALERLTGDEALFANRAHDFPALIRYAREGERLRTRVAGDGPGAPAPKEWLLERQAGRTPDCARAVRKRIEVAAPAGAVREAWSTEAGVRTFLAPAAKVEARAGGAFELYFAPEAEAGTRGSEGCVFLELAPARLAFTWNFPPSLPAIRGERTLVEVRLEALAPERTRVWLDQRGFEPGADWEAGQAYFERAWGLVLARLAQRFEAGPVDWSAPG